MAAVASMVGMISASGLLGLDPRTALLVTAVVFLVTGGGNVVNDYFDRDIDAVNRPSRPVPSGRISPVLALRWSFLLFLLGSALALMINPLCLALAAANSLLLVAYAGYLKATPLAGNLTVAYLTGSTFLFGGLATGSYSEITAVLSILAGLATLGREIVKDVEDVDGDRAGGARTLPILFGPALSSRAAAAAVLCGVALSYLAPLGRPYLVAVTAANILFLASVRKALQGEPSASQRFLKLGMALALVAFTIGSL